MRARAELAAEVMAIAGNTIRRSLDRADSNGALHVVSAWASTKALGLAQWNVADNRHEITAPARTASAAEPARPRGDA